MSFPMEYEYNEELDKDVLHRNSYTEKVFRYYYGNLVTENGKSENDIKRRIMIVGLRTTFTNMRTLLSSGGIHPKAS